MSDAKTEILSRIHNALHDHPAAPEVPRAYRQTSNVGREELLEMLEDRLIDYKAGVYRETAETLPNRIAELLNDGARIVIPAGLRREWLPGSIEPVLDEQLGVRDLDALDGVITSSTVSCAETGTIFLSGREDEGRRAISLVPDHHICIVPVDSIVELIPEALKRVEPTAPITMISGPSATSDIELERVEGVHGPRTLDVVLLG
ncbi:Lactate utilization protein C [Corynebacterium atrinae]|uniref:LutC/YkgG family protein n=1 Tax=Corynebacterium atrinae TaxID=1336740 RepID=UPI0025B40DA7|nr:LUD domain-containing protein [Corynebacterium atrinae]WJY62217.1 Lactate utilization protein C [Corynebacterium atrinae]